MLELIKKRQSIRSYKPDMPTDEQIMSVVEAGLLAPSFLNVQPWHFIVVKDPAIKSLLTKLSSNQPHVATAPVLIACCGDLRAWEYENFKNILISRPGMTEERVNQILTRPALNPALIDDQTVLLRTVEQVTYATAYMTLEAVNQGLGTCIIGGLGNPLTRNLPDVYEVVKEELGLPKEMILVSLLTLGIPCDDTLSNKSRKAKSEVLSFDKIN